MGQTNSYAFGQNCVLQLVQQFPIGKVVKQQQSGAMHFLKQHSYNTQQTFQYAFIKFSKKLTEKHQNILTLQKTNTKVQNTFCSTFYKIVLVFQYIDHTLKDEIQMRDKENRKFQQKQIWSILFHCTLALAHLRRTQGFEHSAIRPEDIRLSSQGVIKILPTQMVGISGEHDQNQATTKILAMTIIGCIMMKHISNQSNQFLQAVIYKLTCSDQLKKLLNIMITEKQSFQKVQEYLFRLAQDDADSVLSGVSTPVIRSHQKPTKESRKIMDSFQNIQIDIKIRQPDFGGLQADVEDQTDRLIRFQSSQQQNPDQNDHQQSLQQNDQNHPPLTEKLASQKQNKVAQISTQKQQYRQNYQNQNKIIKDSNRQTVRITSQKKELGVNKIEDRYQQTNMSAKDKQNIYTDPKLLDWIKNDLHQLKSSSVTPGFSHQGQPEDQSKPKHQQENNLINHQSSQHESIRINSSTVSQKVNNNFISKLNNQQKKQLKITKEQQCFGNILDEEASFKKSKSHKKTIKQNQIVSCKKNLNVQSAKINNQKQQNTLITKENQTRRLTMKAKDTISESRNQDTQRSIPSIVNDSTKKSSAFQHNQSKFQKGSFNKLEMDQLNNVCNQSSTKNQSSNVSKPKFDKNNPEVPKLQYVTQSYQKGKYEGQKLNGLRHGHGTFLYNEGGRYVGEWKQNKMEGKGILYYPNNTIAYQGNWKNDQLHGSGTLYNEETEELNGPFDYRDWTEVEDYWVKYQGMFNFDNKEGVGKLFLSNGQIFDGNFLQDLVHGEGTLSRRDGSRVKGYWRNSKLIRMF